MAENENKRNRLILLVLVLGTIALYSPTFIYDFVNFDDPRYLVNNYHIAGGFSARAWAWCFQAGYAANWHPLTWISHMLDCQIYGLRPGAHHATNVFLHAANSALLFLVLFRSTGARWRSALVAAFFAWHPMHVESVAWVSERKDVLSTLFWMLTMLAYVSYVQRRGWRRYLVVLLMFALGLMAKQMLVTLPFVLLLLDWWPLRRFQSSEKLWPILLEKALFFPLIITSSVLTLIAQQRGGALSSLATTPLIGRLMTVDISYYRYMLKLLWPQNMAVIYPYEYIFSWAETIVGVVVLLALSVAAVLARKNRPYLLIGWLWFLGTLVPVIGLVQVGAQSMADRYTYIPSIGFFIMIVWGVADWFGGCSVHASGVGWRRRAVLTGGFILAGVSACATSLQLRYWYDGGTLFSHSIAVTEENFISYCSYAAFLRDKNELEKARVQAEMSVHIAPEYSVGHNFLGEILLKQGKLDEAIVHLELAKKYRRDATDAFRDLGVIYQQKNQPEKALSEFAGAAKIEPEDPTIYFLMANTLLTLDRQKDALAALAEAIRLAPNYAEAHSLLGSIFSSQQKIPEAIEQYRLALKYVPDYMEVLNNLAWLLTANADAKYRNGAEAVKLATQACELTNYRQPLFIGTLAAAYAEAGKFDQAEANAKKASELALVQGDKAVAAKNKELLELYHSHQAYHETNSVPAKTAH